jgi:hypothetical protein
MAESPTGRDAIQAVFIALQQRALDAGIELRPPPPEPTICCGRGCNGCVWEGWYSAVEYWREDAEAALLEQAEAMAGR